jgi:hypothetical protein
MQTADALASGDLSCTLSRVALENSKVTATNSNELLIQTHQTPSFVARRVWNELQSMTCVKSQLKIKCAFPYFDRDNDGIIQLRVDRFGSINPGRQSKLLAIVKTRQSNTAFLDKSPKTPDNQIDLPIKNKNPVEFATANCHKAMLE